jgi:hypothetical protein
MSDEAIQIFITYARDDDLPPPDLPSERGFVKFLHDYLNYKFQNFGPLRPIIWRDVDNIYRGEQFLPKIHEELSKSSLLLAILSPNWMSSEYCRGELDYFIECRKRLNEPIVERIVAVEKNEVDRALRPVGLQNQEGYRFYAHTGRQIGPVSEFFERGKPNNAYWPVFDELFAFLLNRLGQLSREPFTAPEVSNGRTVYVAKPASDMFDDYIRVVAELTKNGYSVVPSRPVSIPIDGSAMSFIDAELAKAEASVHLLGESAGWKPEGLDEIVKLQLARAAAKVESSKSAPAKTPFRRILWAPKLFQRARASGGSDIVERDPQEALSRFGFECIDDKVFGEDFGNFRDAMVRCLDHWAPKLAAPAEEPSDLGDGESKGKVLLLHHESDRDLARGLRRVLSRHHVEAVFPARDGDEVERKSFDKAMMRVCDAIVICWGKVSETWTRSQASQLDDWRALGRKRKWEPRSVVLGPPPGPYKAEFKEDGPPNEIDEVVVVEDLGAIAPDEVRRLIPRRAPLPS